MKCDCRIRNLCISIYQGACIWALTICLCSLPLLAKEQRLGGPVATVQGTAGESAPEGKSPPSPPPADQPAPPALTLPAGTVISARVMDYLSSDRNRPGDGFTAVLQQPLVADGWVVSRRGQTVLGRVTAAQKAGRVKGVSELGLELSELILVDGHQVSIRTQPGQYSGNTSRDAMPKPLGPQLELAPPLVPPQGEDRVLELVQRPVPPLG